MLESADACGVGLTAVSGDVVESVCYLPRSFSVRNSAFIKPKLPSLMNYEPLL